MTSGLASTCGRISSGHEGRGPLRRVDPSTQNRRIAVEVELIAPKRRCPSSHPPPAPRWVRPRRLLDPAYPVEQVPKLRPACAHASTGSSTLRPRREPDSASSPSTSCAALLHRGRVALVLIFGVPLFAFVVLGLVFSHPVIRGLR